MKIKHYYWINTLLAILIIFTIYYVVSPYKFSSSLPKIKASDVEHISISGYSTDKKCYWDKLPQIIDMYNDVREMNIIGGSTPEITIRLDLKDTSTILISNLRDEEVEISYSNSKKNIHYQTIAESKKLANFLNNIRKFGDENAFNDKI